MGLPLQTIDYYDNSGGLDLKSSDTKVQDPNASESLNVDYSQDGAFGTRNGSTILNITAGIPAQIAGAPRTQNLFDFKKEDGTSVEVIYAGTNIYQSLSLPVSAVSGLSGTIPIGDFEKMVTADDEYLFFGNGIDTNRKFDGTTWTNWSIVAPAAPVPSDFAAGTLSGTFEYAYTHARTVASVIVQESDMSPTASITVAGGRTVRVTIAVSSDSQVNARVIYRKSPTSGGLFLRLTTILNNSATTHDDNTQADGTIQGQFDNEIAPNSAVFEEYLGRMYIVNTDKKTDVRHSKINRPWNVPTANLTIFDGEVKCIRRFYGSLIFGTNKSIWVLNGDIATNAPRRVSSVIGILNNRCAVGEDFLYIVGTNRKAYRLTPTDFSQSEVRFDKALSLEVDPIFQSINNSGLDNICMEYYTKADVAKVMICLPITSATCDRVVIYNEAESLRRGSPVWQNYDNWFVGDIKQFIRGNDIQLISSDYNGFLWHLDTANNHGDGSEINGTVTSATATTLTDTAQSYTVNEHVGKTIRIISGTDIDDLRTVISNTVDTVTVSAWSTTPDITSTFTIGGYDAIHFSNWKFVTGSYDTLKQLWFFLLNANALGNYTIDLVFRTNFDTSQGIEIPISLSGGNAIWGSFLWGAGIWGAVSVFQKSVRQYSRFQAISVGFKNREAGEPFQINGFSISAQDKGLFFKKAA